MFRKRWKRMMPRPVYKGKLSQDDLKRMHALLHDRLAASAEPGLLVHLEGVEGYEDTSLPSVRLMRPSSPAPREGAGMSARFRSGGGSGPRLADARTAEDGAGRYQRAQGDYRPGV
jgi:hypothetical protein